MDGRNGRYIHRWTDLLICECVRQRFIGWVTSMDLISTGSQCLSPSHTWQQSLEDSARK
jgi:hypothetical protein